MLFHDDIGSIDSLASLARERGGWRTKSQFFFLKTVLTGRGAGLMKEGSVAPSE
jgi:hypothetical protein